MKNCVIFDANFLISYKNDLKDIKKVVEKKSDIYIPQMVMEEISSQQSRKLIDDNYKIQSLIKKTTTYYCMKKI